MEVLRWIGYIIVSTVGLCAAVVLAIVMGAIGASIGSILVGGFLVVLGAAGLHEYFNPVELPKRDT